ncbi:MAG TPA: phage tail tip lysozyme, partial [Rhizomicrobium sp.]|nr:phage tail tip lysozyme [Rhizomicrobium sp.]
MADDTPWTGRANVRQAMDFFTQSGWTPEQAAGIVANLYAESRVDPYRTGDRGLAYGIAQWHPDRQTNYANWAVDQDIGESGLPEQLNFVQHELTKG